VKDVSDNDDVRSSGDVVRTTGSKPARTSPVTFYRQVVAELRKVVWPTREQLITYFFVVMVFVIVMMTLVSLLDLGLGKLAFEVFAGRDSQ
jgi:preprotein translocase subunit SecE